MSFQVIGRDLAVASWTGTPQSLAVDKGVTMPQTPNGSMVVAYWNLSTQNNDGTLSLTSGGDQPRFLDVPALANQPSLVVGNWRASNLTLTNISANAATAIEVEAFGPGIPGTGALPLGINEPLQLSTLDCAAGPTLAAFMQLKLLATSGNLTVVALVGGPLGPGGTNAQVVALNCSDPTPSGYSQATAGTALTIQFNWGAASIFVANMSPATAAPVQVTLIGL